MSIGIGGKGMNMEMLKKLQGMDSQQGAGVQAGQQMQPQEGAGALSDSLAGIQSGGIQDSQGMNGMTNPLEVASSAEASNNSSENGGANEEAAAIMAKLKQQMGGQLNTFA